MTRFSLMLVLVIAATGCTLELDDLSDLLTIRVGGEDETCLDQFEACVESGEDAEQCVAQLQECRDEDPTEPPPGEEQCFVIYDQCMEGYDETGGDGDGDTGDDRYWICEEQLRECLEGVDPTDPPEPTPEEHCYEEYDRCIDADGDGGADGDGDIDDDGSRECEEMLRSCLEGIEPVEPPPAEEQCYQEHERCMEEFPEGAEDGWQMCDEMLHDCLAGIEPVDPPPAEDRCYEEYEMCLADFPDGSDDGWMMCEERLRECLEGIEPVEPPPVEEECFVEYEHCLAEYEDVPDEEGRWMCDERLNECLEGF